MVSDLTLSTYIFDRQLSSGRRPLFRDFISLEGYVSDYKYQKGDILDVGCATCQMYRYLIKKGWKGKYYGIDFKKYSRYKYPEEVTLTIGDAQDLDFPDVDTVLLYNILEHVDNPLIILKKALNAAKKNVLIYVPKRNEEMWKYSGGVVEYHQLDKTHKHCGFSKEEIYRLVDLAGGKITSYRDAGKIDATVGIGMWNSKIPPGIVYLLSKIFSSRTYYKEMWCEVVKK